MNFWEIHVEHRKEYKERIIANKKLRCEINDLKTQLQEAEKELASMKSDSSY